MKAKKLVKKAGQKKANKILKNKSPKKNSATLKKAKHPKTLKMEKKTKKPAVHAKKPLPQENKIQKKESKEDVSYVELTVRCTECSKEVKIVTIEGSDNSEYLCQKCSTGDYFEDDDEG